MRRKKNPWKRLMYFIKLGARKSVFSSSGKYLRGRKKDIKIEITWEDLKNQFEAQNGKCYWFDIDLDPLLVFEKGNPMAISADRLDNKKGYVKGNFVISSRFANLGRRDCPEEKFKEIIKSIKDSWLH